ncbi:MAG: GtrA family protein [Rikenellaceae bacterium]
MQRRIIKIVDWFYFPFIQRFIPLQTFRYAATGGANMVLDAVLYFLIFHFVLHESDLDLRVLVISPQVAAYMMTFPIIFLTGMWMAKNITFQNSILRDSTQRFRYLMVTLANILIKYGGIKGLVYVGFFPSIANASMTVVTVIFSYFMQHNFTFKGTKYEQ